MSYDAKWLEETRAKRTKEICSGNIEVWDQTLGCPECQEELWNYPGMEELRLTTEEYENRFFKRHPFMFTDCHDNGDEDTSPEEVPIGGYEANYNRMWFGNAKEKWRKK